MFKLSTAELSDYYRSGVVQSISKQVKSYNEEYPGRLRIALDRFDEDAFFELEEWFERFKMQDVLSPESFVYRLVEATLKVLSFRFSAESAEEQVHKDEQAMAWRKIYVHKRKQHFVETLTPIKPLLEEAVNVASAEVACNLGEANFNQLTKNALQMVCQFFEPWGREFCVLRTVNKRMNAAYMNHIKHLVTAGNYFESASQSIKEESTDSVNDLLRKACSMEWLTPNQCSGYPVANPEKNFAIMLTKVAIKEAQSEIGDLYKQAMHSEPRNSIKETLAELNEKYNTDSEVRRALAVRLLAIY